MTNESRSDQEADVSRDTAAFVTPTPGGSAMLDAQVEMSKHQSGDPEIDKPIATNFTKASDTTDPTDAKSFTTTGAYPADQNRLEKDYDISLAGHDQDNPASS